MNTLTSEQILTQAQLSRKRLDALHATTRQMGLVEACKFDSFLLGALSFTASEEAWNAAVELAMKKQRDSRKFTLDDALEMGGYDPEAQEWTRKRNDFPVAKPTHEDEVPF